MEKNKKIDNIINDLVNVTDMVIKYNNSDNNFIFERNNTNKIIKTKEFVTNNKILKNNINKNIKEIYRKEVINFINILEKELDHCNLENINNNLDSLSVQTFNNFKFTNKNTLAFYNIFSNKLLLINKNWKKTITHELLHMTTCKKLNNKYICCGFDIVNLRKSKKYGVFINEGYTELINNRYFTETNCYSINKVFVHLLEIIIGKDLMEKLYFNTDLVGLINELMKYNNTLEDVIKFIINTDTIHKNLFKLSIKKRIKLRKSLIEVNDFLINTYYEKVKTYAKTEEDYNIPINLFIGVLKTIKLDIGFNDKYVKELKEYKEKKLVKN